MNNIYKVIRILTIIPLLYACAAAEDSSGPDWTPGIYTGSFTPSGGTAQPSVVMITSDYQALYTETDIASAGLGTVSGDTVSLGGQATMSLTDISQTDGLTGTYVFGNAAGSFSLAASDAYNHGSAAATLNGTYDDNTYTSQFVAIGATTWQFSNGAFSFYSPSTGCSAIGTVTPIDTRFNEYSVNMTIQYCTDYDGVYNGLAFTDDTNSADDTINMLVQNAAGDRLIFSAAVRR